FYSLSTCVLLLFPFFPSTSPPRTTPYTLSLHDALPISETIPLLQKDLDQITQGNLIFAITNTSEKSQTFLALFPAAFQDDAKKIDRKSTRLNSSHEWISYAVFCLKKKKKS